MRRLSLLMAGCLAVLAGCAATGKRPDPSLLRGQVEETERAFARTMADRDFAAFTSFLYDEATVLPGPSPFHGKQEVADAWKRYFEKRQG